MGMLMGSRRPLVSAACAIWTGTLLLALPQAQSAPPAARTEQAPDHVPLFAPSSDCMACHNNLTTAAGEDVSIGSTWRSSIMANSARDPYWQASVRRETLDHPSRSDHIQDECSACHMPIANRLAHQDGRTGAVFAHLVGETDEDQLALDGISCTVCHQISSEGLGTRGNFNGQFVMPPARADGVRPIFGPFEVDAGRRRIMRSSSGGFEQEQGLHVRQSEICATCHTLITEAFGPDGEVIGSLPEQMNYQEWQHSAFSREGRSCQSCHMPRVTGPVRIASVLGDYRDGLSRHLFVGGNAFMVRMLNRYRTELGVEALPVELEATARATERQLQEDTATVTIGSAALAGGTLAFDAEVGNLTGHKFPTGYPSRRTWLHVTIRDRAGRTVFESGAVTPEGSIVGNEADMDPTRFEPHYDRITEPDQVQIYEPILGDSAGRPTTGLLTAVRYLKDNRLLPRGFDKGTADAGIAVYGAALADDSFVGARDRVRYEVPVPSGEGPYRIDVVLRYQPIGFRWAHNLEPYDAPEPQRFVAYYASMSNASSTEVARATMPVGD